MKFLLSLIILTNIAQATDVIFSVERSTPLGLDKIEIKEVAANFEILKTSNYFDVKDDLRLGKFSATEKEMVKTILGELAQISTELKQAEERLSTLNTSFNELNSNKNPHEPFFKLNGFIIKKGSILYPRLEKVAFKINNLSLSLVDGVELDKGRKNYVFFKDGKEVKKESFNARFFCESPKFPTRCLAREWGALYLE
ncbi:MAG: hypothetical protein LW878_00010 [Proteobacteria bacterium]|nr:hypothetical protein [Pseudomonadota bacterium]